VTNGDRGKPLLTVVLALVTLVTSVVIALQLDASTATADAERRADTAGLERSEADARGAGDQIIDYGLYRAWYEQVQRAGWAAQQAQLLGGSDPAQAALLTALAQADTVLADWVRTNSSFLQPPFFDEQTYAADFIGYVADRAKAGLRAGERFDTANATANQSQSRSGAFAALLTVLAAALLFLGLAITTRGRPRRVLAATGLAFTLVGGLGAVMVAAQPVHRVSDEAIDAVVRATGEVIQGAPRGSLTITDSQRQHAEAAIAAAAEAVALDSQYPGAWRSQGEANLSYATAQFFSSEHPDVSGLVSKAIEGYERALGFGGQNFTAQWNLGWANYLAGDWAGSLEATDAALADTPDRFTLYLNRALVELATGDPARALATVESGLDVAARVQLGTNGSFLSQSDFEIGRLAELRPAEAETLHAIRRRIREAEVSIATSGQARTPEPTGTVTVTSLSPLVVMADGSLASGQAVAEGGAIPANSVSGFRLALTGDGAAGSTVSLRVRVDGRIDEGYSQVLTMPDTETAAFDLITPYGWAGFPVNAGSYEVEVYLDGHLAGSRTMTVAGS
jgi:hypothetical protein